jgi:hypothetical protein
MTAQSAMEVFHTDIIERAVADNLRRQRLSLGYTQQHDDLAINILQYNYNRVVFFVIYAVSRLIYVALL